MEEVDEPLDLSWPTTLKQQITYVLVAPLMFPLWIILPDVRRPVSLYFFLIIFVDCVFFHLFVFCLLL